MLDAIFTLGAKAYIFQRPFLSGFFLEELIYGVKFEFQNRFSLPYSCFVLLCIWGQFSKYKPQGAFIWRGDLREGFLRHRFGGAYIWRGLFSEFYGIRGISRYRGISTKRAQIMQEKQFATFWMLAGCRVYEGHLQNEWGTKTFRKHPKSSNFFLH